MQDDCNDALIARHFFLIKKFLVLMQVDSIMFDQDFVKFGRSNFKTIKIYGQLKPGRVETVKRARDSQPPAIHHISVTVIRGQSKTLPS